MELANIRIKEHFGLVTNDTNTAQFNFLVSPPKNRETIEKQDIICFDHPIYGDACQVLAEVKEITSYEEVAGSTIGGSIGKLLATAQVFGYVDLRQEDKPLRKLLTPPNPGSRVYMPYAAFLQDTLNRGPEGKTAKQPLLLGKAAIFAASQNSGSQQVNCYLSAAELTGKHTLISAVDGAGKTYTATILIEELANKTNHTIVILDPNNEYSALGAVSQRNEDYPFKFETAIVNSNSKMSQDLVEKIRANQVTILTAENLSLAERNDYYANVLTALVRARREKVLQPLLIVVEDAENLPPKVIEEVVSMKDGVAAVLVSSHPMLLGGKTLSKVGNQIVGKTTDLQDLAILKNMIGGSDEQMWSLGVGEWVVNGLNVVRPMKIHIRERFSK